MDIRKEQRLEIPEEGSRDIPEENSGGPKESRLSTESPWNRVVINCGPLELYPHVLTKMGFERCFSKNQQLGFASCGLIPGYKVQGYCFPYIFRKDNIIVHAEKGSGKTVAALMMALGEITKMQSALAQAVIVCRTCESAQNCIRILKSMLKFCPEIKVRKAVRGCGRVNGKVDEQVVVGTFDKVLELIPWLSDEARVCLLVLDEVEAVESDRCYRDRLVRISHALRKDKLILLCSVPPKPAIDGLVSEVSTVSPHSLVFPFPRCRAPHEQIFVECGSHLDKLSLVEKVASRDGQILFICERREMSQDVVGLLKEKNEKVAMMNGKVKAPIGQLETSFKEGSFRILVTTRNFARVTTPYLHTVVNCDVILTHDQRNLDHEAYQKHMALLSNKKLGCLVNVISPKWVGYVLDEKGKKLKPIAVKDLPF